jgi:hypothetical protein
VAGDVACTGDVTCQGHGVGPGCSRGRSDERAITFLNLVDIVGVVGITLQSGVALLPEVCVHGYGGCHRAQRDDAGAMDPLVASILSSTTLYTLNLPKKIFKFQGEEMASVLVKVP